MSSSPFPSPATTHPQQKHHRKQIRHFVDPATHDARCLDIPVFSALFNKTARRVPRRVIDRVVSCCLGNQNAQGAVQTSRMKSKGHNTAGDATWAEGGQGGAETAGRECFRGLRPHRSMHQAEPVACVQTPSVQCVLPLERQCNAQGKWGLREASLINAHIVACKRV